MDASKTYVARSFCQAILDSLGDDDGLESDTGRNSGAKQTSEMVHNFDNDDLAWYSFFTWYLTDSDNL